MLRSVHNQIQVWGQALLQVLDQVLNETYICEDELYSLPASVPSPFRNVLIKLRSPVFENSYYGELIDLSILDYLKNNA